MPKLSDRPVALGAALGVAVSLVTALMVRRRRRRNDEGVVLDDIEVAPGLGPVTIVINPSSGSADGVDLDDVPVRELREGEDLDAVLRGLADDGIAVLGVAGGDGSVGCAAQVALDRDRTLWAVPGGTLNHFARALGFTAPDQAMEGLAAGRVASVDVGEADGVVFVNNASLGVYGELVRRREALEHRLPKRIALLVAAGSILRRADPLDVEIDGVPDRVYLVFVGNNAYTGAGLTGRESLQAGLLDVRILSAAGRLPRLTALASILTGRHGSSRWLTQSLRSRLDVSLREPAVLAHDGEARDVVGDVRFAIRPRALRVVVPDPGS